MNNVILSYRHPEFVQRLRALGYHTIPSETLRTQVPYECDHADLQCLIINDTAFVAEDCSALKKVLSSRYTTVSCAKDIRGRYPKNVALNAVLLEKYIICKIDSLDPAIREYCARQGYTIVNVRQGYTKCSCAVVGDHAIITADKGIYNSLRELNKISVLLIGEGSVRMDGTTYGFIGGASGYNPVNNTIYFCGNILRHPDGDRIISFCNDHSVKAISLTEEELIDIGGMIFC